MTSTRRSQLLVSVRSSEEAAIALRGGADLIDIKEPQLGSLGRASNDVIRSVVCQVAGRRPVSAALGELCLDDDIEIREGLQFIKFGLAGCAGGFDWRGRMTWWRERLASRQCDCVIVHVAYADWMLADAPPLSEVLEEACRKPGGVFLIDTWQKNTGRSLLNWLNEEQLGCIVQQCRSCGIRIGLAGSLSRKHIGDLLELEPDWFAVRGAVCESGRQSSISEGKVRRLSEMLNAVTTGRILP